MNRLELKFEISDINEKNLISNLKLTKEFNDRNITSIYYDTDLFKYYHDSEEGLTPRKKVRLRFYNENKNKKNLEIKFTLANYRKKITFNNVSELEIGEYLKNINIDDNIKPKLIINYTRKYFKNRQGRFNIDYNIFSKNLKIQDHLGLISNPKNIRI